MILQSSRTEICFRLSFTDAPKNKISRSGMFEKELWCWWVSDNAWLAMQTGCFKLGKHFKLPSFMKYVYLFIYLFIHVFSHLFPHLLACNLTLCSFIANEILVHFLLFCHLVSLWLHFWETGLSYLYQVDPSLPRKEQYIPISNVINFSLQLFQFTEACFQR